MAQVAVCLEQDTNIQTCRPLNKPTTKTNIYMHEQHKHTHMCNQKQRNAQLYKNKHPQQGKHTTVKPRKQTKHTHTNNHTKQNHNISTPTHKIDLHETKPNNNTNTTYRVFGFPESITKGHTEMHREVHRESTHKCTEKGMAKIA